MGPNGHGHHQGHRWPVAVVMAMATVLAMVMVVVASDPQDCWPKEGKRGPESSPKVLRPSTRVVTVPFPLPREIEEKYSYSKSTLLGGAREARPQK